MGNTRRSRATSATGTNIGAEGGRIWTAGMIRALGASTDLATAAQIFNLSMATAYRLIKRDAFPVPVIRAGAHYRVPVAPILTALRLPHEADPAEEP